MNSKLTKDDINDMVKLCADGFTATQIAIHIGKNCTRDMVIGELRRLGLRCHRLTAEQRFQCNPTPQKPKIVKPKGLEKPEQVLGSDGNPLTLWEATRDQCRYIEGEPVGDVPICGADTRPGFSYCDYHDKICHVTTRAESPQSQEAPHQ